MITIDKEYEGHEADIKAMLLHHMRRVGLELSPDVIRFERVGKKSRAHKRAWGVQRGKIAPDHEVTVEELLGCSNRNGPGGAYAALPGLHSRDGYREEARSPGSIREYHKSPNLSNRFKCISVLGQPTGYQGGNREVPAGR